MVTTLGKVLNKIKSNLPSIYMETAFLANAVSVKIQSIHAKMLCVYMRDSCAAETFTSESFYLHTNVWQYIQTSNNMWDSLCRTLQVSSIPGPTH